MCTGFEAVGRIRHLFNRHSTTMCHSDRFERFEKPMIEILDILLRISDTRTWSSSRVETLRQIRIICRRAERDLFGNLSWVNSIRPEISSIFPELFNLDSREVFGQRSDMSIKSLVWIRDSLTKLWDRLAKHELSEAPKPVVAKCSGKDIELLSISWRAFL